MVKRQQKLKMDGVIVREPLAALNESRSPGPMNYTQGQEAITGVSEESH
jgi:hypothetical protein